MNAQWQDSDNMIELRLEELDTIKERLAKTNERLLALYEHIGLNFHKEDIVIPPEDLEEKKRIEAEDEELVKEHNMPPGTNVHRIKSSAKNLLFIQLTE